MDGSRARIVVADDEDGIRRLLVELLVDDGYEVLEASDGLSAIRLLHTPPKADLLITDIDMPGADGWAVATEARRNDPSVGLILISGRYEKVDETCEPLNATFLQKPFTLRLLLNTVHAELPGGTSLVS